MEQEKTGAQPHPTDHGADYEKQNGRMHGGERSDVQLPSAGAGPKKGLADQTEAHVSGEGGEQILFEVSGSFCFNKHFGSLLLNLPC